MMKTRLLFSLRHRGPSDDEARLLLKKLMDGSSTPAEEKRLYTYYRRTDLPDDLEAERGFVGWLASGMDDKSIAAHRGKKRKFFTDHWASVAATAASIAVVVTILGKSTGTDEKYEMFAGSYTIVNGVKNENISEIYADLLEAQQNARKAEALIEQHMKRIAEQERIIAEIEQREQEIEERMSPENLFQERIFEEITDPAQRELIMNALQQ